MLNRIIIFIDFVLVIRLFYISLLVMLRHSVYDPISKPNYNVKRCLVLLSIKNRLVSCGIA